MNPHTEPTGESSLEESPVAAPSGPIRVTATEESPVVYNLAVEVDAKRVGKAFDRAYRDLGRRVKVKGFRPGKIPRAMLEKLYAPAMAEQIEHSLVQETIAEAIGQSGVLPVAEPAVETESAVAGEHFKYTLRVEVKPTIELPDLDGLPAIRPEADVTDAEVDEHLETLRTRNAPAVEEPDGTQIETGHILSVDFVGRIDGEAFEGGSGQDVELEVGAGRFIPGFEEQLVGARAGDDVEVSVTFPDPYGNAELAGRDAVFACHVAAVKKRQVPELDDEFAKDVGDFENLEALRQRVRDDLVAARERESQQVLRKSLLEALLERTEFEVPAGMIEGQLERQLQAAHQKMHGQLPDEAIHEQMGQWREQWRPDAEREVREGLVLAAIAEREQIEADEAEIDAKIQSMAAEQGVDAATLERAAGDADLRRAMGAQLVDEKTLAFLAGKAKVEGTTDS